MQETEPKLYEISYLIKTGEAEDGLERIAVISEAVEKEKGMIVFQREPQRKILSYPIRKEKEAWWGWLKFMARPEAAETIKEKLRGNPAILRLMMIKTTRDERLERPRRLRKLAPSPSAMPQKQVSVEEIDKKLEEMLGA